VPFDSLEDFQDIESLNYYRDAVARGHRPADVLAALRRESRDNARTPVQWTGGSHAGFTTGTPWLSVNPNHTWLNAESQRTDPRSVFSYYRALVALRHSEPVVVDGDFTMLLPDHPAVYAFERRLGPECLAVYANLSDEPEAVALPDGELVLHNVDEGRSRTALGPWEARVYRLSDTR
jgi:oligo-1,6-glucosidase